MHYFQAFQPVTPDPILGLVPIYQKDPNPNKINLTIGVYQTDQSEITLFKSVYEAEKILLGQKLNKGYAPMDGDPAVRTEILKLTAPNNSADHFYVAHTAGSTSAIRLGGDLLKIMGIENIYIGEPTWPNHQHVFRCSGLKTFSMPYYNYQTHQIEFDQICQALEKIPPKSAALFQMACHNPTGCDPSIQQWKKIIDIVKSKNIFPIIDFAYHGFGQGLDEDILPFQLFIDNVDEVFLCYSFAKNFGLYGERAGGFIAFDRSKKNISLVGDHSKKVIRSFYSSPPIQGGRIIKTVLQSAELKKMWQQELDEMRMRLKSLRELFVKALEKEDFPVNFQFLLRDQGLFSLMGLNENQVLKLRNQSGVYLLDNSRINIAALRPSNMEYVAQSLRKVF